jgi:hypothetical protein
MISMMLLFEVLGRMFVGKVSRQPAQAQDHDPAEAEIAKLPSASQVISWAASICRQALSSARR